MAEKMLKSYGRRHGIWIGWGTQSERTPVITRSWLRSVLPPYMLGPGVSFALGHKSIRIGVYKVLGNLDPFDYDDIDVDEELELLEGLGWRSGVEEGEVIGRWQSSQRTGSADPEATSSASAPLDSLAPISTPGASPSPAT